MIICFKKGPEHMVWWKGLVTNHLLLTCSPSLKRYLKKILNF